VVVGVVVDVGARPCAHNGFAPEWVTGGWVCFYCRVVATVWWCRQAMDAAVKYKAAQHAACSMMSMLLRSVYCAGQRAVQVAVATAVHQALHASVFVSAVK
jgi:hypothetical protein